MKVEVFATAAAVAVVLAGSVAPAGGDPKKNPPIQVQCGTLGTLQIATNGNGQWTPGHVIGTTQVLIPYRFEFRFTPAGSTQTFVENFSKPAPRNGRLDRCTFSETGPEGTFSGTVWGSYTPRR